MDLRALVPLHLIVQPSKKSIARYPNRSPYADGREVLLLREFVDLHLTETQDPREMRVNAEHERQMTAVTSNHLWHTNSFPMNII